MAYIGFAPVVQTTSTATQQFNGDGTTLQFNLQQGISKASDIIVQVGNALQIPGTDYYVTSTALIFNAGKAPTAGTNNVSVTFIAGGLATINITTTAYPIGNTVAPSIFATTSSATGIYWPSTTSLAFTASGNTRVIVSDASGGVATSTTSGALRVQGGLGVSGDTYVGGVLNAAAVTPSSSTTTGALVVSGGLGVAGATYIGGSMTVSGGLTVAGTFNTTSTNSLTINTPFLFLANTNVGDAIDQGFVGQYVDTATRFTGLVRTASDGRYKLFANLTNPPSTLVDTANVSFRYADMWVANSNITSTVQSVSSLTGAMTIWGGLGIRNQIYVNDQNNAIAIGNGGTSGVGNIGASGATFNTAFLRSTSAQYADVAEKYLADADYEAGTVLDFGGAEEVTLCDTDMSRKLAGVVSTQPAYLMNDAIQGDHTVALALLGRVPCKVRGPIAKGDMLVSAGEGHARAETLPQIGTVIGKALEDFVGDHGVIEVVVGRV
jgi:uncharacterized protein YjbI with pentapeptide repeats